MRCRTGVCMAFLAALAASHPVWADCQAFLDAYNRDPGDAHNDQVLADAAACFEREKSISAALQVDGLLLKYYPNSKHAAAATRQTAELYERIAMYDRAADKLEDYARRFAGEKDAADLLADAIRLRQALGDRAKQIEDTKEWIRTFGVKHKAEGAAAKLSIVAVLDAEAALVQLRELARDAGTVAPDVALAAHLQLADRLRAKSCPSAIDGLCVKVVAVRGPHCGDGTTNLVGVKRSAENREALAEYRATIALADTATEPAARHAGAMARLALADDELEAMLAEPFPRGLDLAKLDGRKRFAEWLDAETKRGSRVDDAYSAVLVHKDAISSVAAAARLGAVAQVFWRALMLGELPAAMRKPPERDAYCDAMKVVAEPLRVRAIETEWTCIAKSVELQAGQDWADVCWRDGAVLDPERFAPVRELRGTPDGFAPPIAVEPAL